MRSDLVDLEMTLHHQTDRAVLVSDSGNPKDAVWIPKSVCEIAPAGKPGSSIYTVTMPERIAIDRGLA